MTAEKPNQFSSLSLAPHLRAVLGDLGFVEMTPIQAQAIPVLLDGKDLMAQSKTGSGKTLAFAIPLLEKIDLRERAVQALVLCPTRELCTQVAREIRRLGRDHRGLQVLILCGGQPARPQAMALANGVHVVVGTPGRTLDHLSRGQLNLNKVSSLVLDEADRMLDMGFEDEMEAILAEVPGTRQAAFFSATYPKSFDKLSKRHLRAPARIKIEDAADAPSSMTHLQCLVDPERKLETLIKQLRAMRADSAFVFCNLKASVSEIAKTLAERGFVTDALHGDLEQVDRDRVMAKFRNGTTRILVATDVAARGLDIPDVQLVVCYDPPHQPDDYIHRVGRTGRADKSGVALTLFEATQMMRLFEIEKAVGTKFAPAESFRFPSKDVGCSTTPHQGAVATISISGGRKDKLRPGDILGALTGEAGGLDARDIGKIEIHDHLTYVAVSGKVAQVAAKRLRAGKIKGRKFLVNLVK